jgi:hypothetical protein
MATVILYTGVAIILNILPFTEYSFCRARLRDIHTRDLLHIQWF